jgi:hypothetical protein
VLTLKCTTLDHNQFNTQRYATPCMAQKFLSSRTQSVTIFAGQDTDLSINELIHPSIHTLYALIPVRFASLCLSIVNQSDHASLLSLFLLTHISRRDEG